MARLNLVARAKDATDMLVVTKATLSARARTLPKEAAAWLGVCGFEGAEGTWLMLPGMPQPTVVCGISAKDITRSFAALAASLPQRAYRIAEGLERAQLTAAATGFGLGGYVFDRYKPSKKKLGTLVWPDGVDTKEVAATVEAIFLIRDLINTPACDMGPSALAKAAQTLGKKHGAKVKVTVGEQLLRDNYPAIHAVGRAAADAPRLIDLHWGTKGPVVTLVGKGVCFDTGGLDLKSSGNMLLMKKDMGGAAHVLGIAAMVMAQKLPVRLRVLIPAVENSVSGNAYRPMDVLQTRKGLTVEVGNTDAEGRIVLADALCEAGEADVLIDFATLTGAARVALGTELPALFANDDDLAARILALGEALEDPLWRLPLHAPYRRMLDSPVADLNNAPAGGYGGAITAALFLQEFVAKKTPWLHVDLMAWNVSNGLGRQTGGEAMAVRATYALIAELARSGAKKRPA